MKKKSAKPVTASELMLGGCGMNVRDALRRTGVVGARARGASFESVAIDAFHRGELRGVPMAMELPEDATYAWMIEPLLEAGGLSERWRVVRHGFGPTPATFYSAADGVVVLEGVDGRRLEEHADPTWVDRQRYDSRVVERILVALSSELPAGEDYYLVGRDLPWDHPDYPSVYVYTVLAPEGVALLRDMGLEVQRIGG